jgi:hypothetical protein
MAHLVRRIAPALLASVAATLVAVVAARAQTPAATPAASTASDCLARPTGPSAKGSHWYYRVQHPSGRHCWYQHATLAVRNVPAHPHVSTEPAAPPRRVAAPKPAPPPVSEASAAPSVDTPSADTPSVDTDNAVNVVPPVAAPPIAAPVNEPPAWPVASAAPVAPSAAVPPAPTPAVPVARSAEVPGAPPAAAPPAPMRSVEGAPPPVPEAPQPQLDAAPAKHPPARTSGAAHNVEFAEEPNHVPALLGAVSALVIIIIGSFAGRLLTRRPRRRPQVNARMRDWPSAVSGVEEDSPGIVPVMPGGGDTAHGAPAREVQALRASPDDYGLRRGRGARRAVPAQSPPIRESTRVLEANVRELLHRLQKDLRGEPAGSAAAEPEHVSTEQELDAVLAIWRAKRAGRA